MIFAGRPTTPMAQMLLTQRVWWLILAFMVRLAIFIWQLRYLRATQTLWGVCLALVSIVLLDVAELYPTHYSINIRKLKVYIPLCLLTIQTPSELWRPIMLFDYYFWTRDLLSVLSKAWKYNKQSPYVKFEIEIWRREGIWLLRFFVFVCSLPVLIVASESRIWTPFNKRAHEPLYRNWIKATLKAAKWAASVTSATDWRCFSDVYFSKSFIRSSLEELAEVRMLKEGHDRLLLEELSDLWQQAGGSLLRESAEANRLRIREQEIVQSLRELYAQSMPKVRAMQKLIKSLSDHLVPEEVTVQAMPYVSIRSLMGTLATDSLLYESKAELAKEWTSQLLNDADVQSLLEELRVLLVKTCSHVSSPIFSECI